MNINVKVIEEDMCPIGLASHLLVDKWVPVILRDISLFDRRTFNQILSKNRENISASVLSSRLNRMVELELLTVDTSPNHSQMKIYTLAEPGIEFIPLLFQLADWTIKHRGPSKEISMMLTPYVGSADSMSEFITKLRKIHIEKTEHFTELWWLKT